MNKKAFTLAELLVAMTISVIIIFFIWNFVINSLNEIRSSNNESNFLESFEDFKFTLNNYRNTFLSWSILIDNTWTWSDVLMLKSLDKSKWIILWVVNKTTMKLENTQEKYNTYYDKVIWYRDLSNSEIIELENSETQVYSYVFFNDKLFNNIKIIDFQLDFFNQNKILEMNIKVNKDYKESLNWISFDNFDHNANSKSFNLSF